MAMSEELNTRELAARLGISRVTLYKWLTDKKIVGPRPIRPGEPSLRLWSGAQVEGVESFVRTIKPGHVGRPIRSRNRR